METSAQDSVSVYVRNGLGAGLAVLTPELQRDSALRVLPLNGFPSLPIGVFWRGRLSEITQVFVNELGTPFSPDGFNWLVKRAGQKARLPFQVHAHMLRHSAGYKLAGDGHDTRAIQDYLGHRNISNTVRYTELSPTRFKNFWRD